MIGTDDVVRIVVERKMLKSYAGLVSREQIPWQLRIGLRTMKVWAMKAWVVCR